MKTKSIYYIVVALAICLASPLAVVAAQSNQSNEPLQNSEITVISNNLYAITSGYATGATSSNGSFTINQDLPTGNYNVTISHPGYIDAQITTDITTNNVTDLGSIYLNASGVIAGKVLDPSGAPQANVTVVLIDQNGQPINSADNFQNTTADGAFYFSTDITNGTYSIGVYFTDLRPYAAPPLLTGINAIQGQTTSGIVIHLIPTGAVAGKITDPNGKGVSNVTVIVYNGSFEEYPWNEVASYAVTDSQGNYNTTNFLPTGTYDVTLMGEPPGVIVGSSSVGTVNVTAGSTTILNLKLAASGSISGKVTNANGSPAAGIIVEAISNSLTTEPLYTGVAIVSDDGSYSINSGLPTGSYQVIELNDPLHAVQVNVIAGEDTPNINFQLGTNPAWISGTVTNSTGLEAYASITGYYNQTETILGVPFELPISNYTETADNGTYLLQINVPSGTNSVAVNISAMDDFGDTSSQLVTLSQGQTLTNVNFLFNSSPSGTLIGNVFAGPPPPSNANLTLSSSTSNTTIGSSLMLSADLYPAQSGNVTIYLCINGSTPTTIANQNLLGNGTCCYTFVPNGTGNFTFWATWSGNSAYNPANSTNTTVCVNPVTNETITIQTSSQSPRIDSAVTISGTSNGNSPEVMILVSVNGSASEQWTTVDVVNGSYSCSYNITNPGNYSFQAYDPVTHNFSTASVLTASATTDYAWVYYIIVIIAVIVAISAIYMATRKKRKPEMQKTAT
jgi:hypothetical protein